MSISDAMSNSDIRWQQRLNSYQRALNQLTKFIEKGTLSELEEQGFIKSFEYTYELAWKLLKDYLDFQGEQSIYGSRDAIRLAFNRNLITNGDIWMDMIKSRNLTIHAYNLDTAKAVADDITHHYFSLFKDLSTTMQSIQNREQQNQTMNNEP
ncbi:MAG: nucleotidyltransferase substrate binding protein [Cyanobacteria bacterium J06614_10]